MTVRIDNLNRTWANSQVDHIGLGLNINASAYGANSKSLRIQVNGNDVFYLDANGVANVVNNIIVAGINVLPYLSNTVIAGNNYSISIGAASNTWANNVGAAVNSASDVKDTAGNNYTIEVGAASNNYSNTYFAKLSGNQTITGGYSVSPFNPTSNIAAYGTWTPDPANGNYQFANSNGAVTIAVPVSNCAIDVLITNGINAKTITLSGYTVGSSTGDTYTTTAGYRFLLMIRKINSIATYLWKALQ